MASVTVSEKGKRVNARNLPFFGLLLEPGSAQRWRPVQLRFRAVQGRFRDGGGKARDPEGSGQAPGRRDAVTANGNGPGRDPRSTPLRASLDCARDDPPSPRLPPPPCGLWRTRRRAGSARGGPVRLRCAPLRAGFIPASRDSSRGVMTARRKRENWPRRGRRNGVGRAGAPFRGEASF